MQPRHYFDIVVTGGYPPSVASQLLRLLHRVFADCPGRYALAFPAYGTGKALSRFRVFAQEGEDLNDLVGHVRPDTVFQHAVLGFPAVVPDDFTGPWVSFSRYRIPSRAAERKPDGTLRLRRLQEADAQGLLYINMRSCSNGHSFRLYVARRPADGATFGEPDSYGLASATRPLAVPDLP